MTTDPTPIDISNMPDLVRIAEEASQTYQGQADCGYSHAGRYKPLTQEKTSKNQR
jgi:hypothetical protein